MARSLSSEGYADMTLWTIPSVAPLSRVQYFNQYCSFRYAYKIHYTDRVIGTLIACILSHTPFPLNKWGKAMDCSALSCRKTK